MRPPASKTAPAADPGARGPGPASGGGRRGCSSTSSAAWRGRGRRACRGRKGRGRPGRPGARRPASRPRSRAGLSASARQSAGSVRWPPWKSCIAAGSSVSRPTAPGAASSKGRRFSSSSCGVWKEPTTSIRPEASASTSRHAVVLGAQRRAQLEEGPVVADVELVERQVVDRGAGRHREPGIAGASEGREGGGGGELVGVVAHAGRLDHRKVALEADALGDRRDGGEPELRGELARGGAGALGQRALLRVAEDQRAEAGGIGQAALEDAGVGNGAAVHEGDGARVHQEADLGHLAAVAALGQRSHRQDVDRARRNGAPLQELERLGRVDRWHGVGAGNDRGDAARRRRCAGGAEALLVPLAGLADLDPDVDDAGGEASPAAVEAGAVALEDLGDAAVRRSRGRRRGCGRPRGRPGGRWSGSWVIGSPPLRRSSRLAARGLGRAARALAADCVVLALRREDLRPRRACRSPWR